MRIWFVVLYWVISVAIGLAAARLVHNTKDYAVAGRSLPLAMVTTTVFATWFGSETVLGIPATFLQGGLGGVVDDPFGSSLCLILVGLFFAIPLYRKNLLTIGDFYKERFGRSVEIITSICVVISYLGWVSAQIIALGLVFNVVSHGAISNHEGMVIGASSILLYTLFGGMWSVAVTDFIQMIIIMVGMVYIAFVVSHHVDGGAAAVVHHASTDGKFAFWPALQTRDVLAFFGAGITMMLGSIPQQDVFQRVASSKNEQTARNASILGGVMYFCFAFVPMFLAYSATIINPNMVSYWMGKDPQQILPQLVLQNVNVVAQVMFFGALLSAIKSCASATLLAPSVTFAENIIKGFVPTMNDKQYLKMMRGVVLVFTALVTWIALHSTSSIYNMVVSAYKVTLVATFVPLVCGLYWKRANNLGALCSIILGLTVWLGNEFFNADGVCPPQLAGFAAAVFGMVAGSLLPVRDPEAYFARWLSHADHQKSHEVMGK